jgi:hypothetical protein
MGISRPKLNLKRRTRGMENQKQFATTCRCSQSTESLNKTPKLTTDTKPYSEPKSNIEKTADEIRPPAFDNGSKISDTVKKPSVQSPMDPRSRMVIVNRLDAMGSLAPLILTETVTLIKLLIQAPFEDQELDEDEPSQDPDYARLPVLMVDDVRYYETDFYDDDMGNPVGLVVDPKEVDRIFRECETKSAKIRIDFLQKAIADQSHVAEEAIKDLSALKSELAWLKKELGDQNA